MKFNQPLANKRWLSAIGMLITFSLLLSACNASEWINSLPGNPTDSPQVTTTSAQPVIQPTAIPQADITFKVRVPDDTPSDAEVYLSIVDEVTGLALNADLYTMAYDEEASGLDQVVYSLTMPFQIGSIIKYRYERQAEAVRVLEHVADGSPVRYRLLHAKDSFEVADTVSRWTDTFFEYPKGRIIGQATDADTGQSIPNLLITAGGAQTLSAADGSFVIENLPPGLHNLVGYAMDGAYQTFQQGAQIAPDSTTPTPISMKAAQYIPVHFQVTAPLGTPPLIPLRMAGNLTQLGNTFGNLDGGVSVQATNMPALQALPDGKYSVTVSLPIGADIRYKYTLGDGFWNAERSEDGDFQVRQFLVKPESTIIEDVIDSWFSGDPTYLQFDVSVPPNTPAEDYVSIQFNPLFGWMQSIPMWQLGPNRWAYLLFSPLNLPGGVSYRYCRSDQCGKADDLATPGESATGRPVDIATLPKAVKDEVTAWVGLDVDPATFPILDAPITARPVFTTGIELIADYHPSWKYLMPNTIDALQELNANTLVLAPTWTAIDNDPTSLRVIPGQDATWPDLVEVANLAHERGLKPIIFPGIRFPDGIDDWWSSAPRDFSWWVTWFDRYQTFVLHHASLAAQTNAVAFVLGGEDISPALPDGVMSDGTPSGVPGDTEQRWRELIAKVREIYPGPIYWALPFGSEAAQSLQAPSFIDAMDQVYLLWSAPLAAETTTLLMDQEAEAVRLLDSVILPVQQQVQKPFQLAVSIPSIDLQTQSDQYNLLLSAAGAREWISGFISRGYYPPVRLQDDSPSIHGKPAEAVIQYWFGGWKAESP